jgi:hypothetical protein
VKGWSEKGKNHDESKTKTTMNQRQTKWQDRHWFVLRREMTWHNDLICQKNDFLVELSWSPKTVSLVIQFEAVLKNGKKEKRREIRISLNVALSKSTPIWICLGFAATLTLIEHREFCM